MRGSASQADCPAWVSSDEAVAGVAGEMSVESRDAGNKEQACRSGRPRCVEAIELQAHELERIRGKELHKLLVSRIRI